MTKNCDNCAIKSDCDYKCGECIGQDGLPTKWISFAEQDIFIAKLIRDALR